MADNIECIHGGSYFKLCGNLNCEFCKQRSFACNEKSKYWSKKILRNHMKFLDQPQKSMCLIVQIVRENFFVHQIE